MEEAPGVLALALAVFPSQPRTPPPRLQRRFLHRPSPGFAPPPGRSPLALPTPLSQGGRRLGCAPLTPRRPRPPSFSSSLPQTPSLPGTFSQLRPPSPRPRSRFSPAPLCAQPAPSRNTLRDFAGVAVGGGAGEGGICDGENQCLRKIKSQGCCFSLKYIDNHIPGSNFVRQKTQNRKEESRTRAGTGHKHENLLLCYWGMWFGRLPKF